MSAEGVNAPHAVIYFDDVLADYDGLGWCVDLFPGSTSYRFAVIDDAAAFVARQQPYFAAAARS